MFAKLSFLALTFASLSASATIVEFTTSHGNFKVNLHDETTPITVANFLSYVNEGSYNNTLVHRVEPGFVMQAGGFQFTGSLPLTAIPTASAIKNEPVYSNVRATIAMAKFSGNEHSATSQWFINLADNSGGSAQLDLQNGGFTVFGEVIEGMENIDAIADLPLCASMPMPDLTTEQCADSNYVPGVENFVTIESVTIFDASVNTASNLAAVKNTAITVTPPTTEPKDTSGSGSITWFGLLFAATLAFKRRLQA
ncbi:Peptidyl-prolyl cis-trans isomerase (rotamase)-cyclophilin family [Colwellia chukchiensis]|uniref:Peptidyl-prolyl cis-trans isomerase n=1 Tax=Colwellia chukchiensis TaxID=641665 RepID=A0A1H7G3Q6_9GAMM|nr:peptidylprolyl isomerase [Colwellia chukchiensis]SEK31080.1 Peptidyl-prolyl cis-trans isomerase (rotamase)-cyclophilin family [Colwellia chukchiensis]